VEGKRVGVLGILEIRDDWNVSFGKRNRKEMKTWHSSVGVGVGVGVCSASLKKTQPNST